MTRQHASRYSLYTRLLEEELIPSLGCTEPIAIAYASALLRKHLGAMPASLQVAASGNLIKNAKSVVVPNTGGMKGIETAAILGALAGDAEKTMEVLAGVTPQEAAACQRLVEQGLCRVESLASSANFHLILRGGCGEDWVEVELLHGHTQVARIEKNGQVLYAGPQAAPGQGRDNAFPKEITLAGIYDYACHAPLEDFASLLTRQMDCNLDIAREGLAGQYGLNVGRAMLEMYGDQQADIRACAYAAAGSDARMAGCPKPVVINAGSGNQGIAASLPVLIFAGHLQVPQETALRALALSNLVNLYQKAFIGRLSAYCGAVSAACGSGAGIAFLHGDGLDTISLTIKNTLANVAGIVCDGAKASCAAKVASAVQAAVLAYRLSKAGHVVQPGDGLAWEDVDATIANYGRLAKDGMAQTDHVILDMMLSK